MKVKGINIRKRWGKEEGEREGGRERGRGEGEREGGGREGGIERGEGERDPNCTKLALYYTQNLAGMLCLGAAKMVAVYEESLFMPALAPHTPP